MTDFCKNFRPFVTSQILDKEIDATQAFLCLLQYRQQ